MINPLPQATQAPPIPAQPAAPGGGTRVVETPTVVVVKDGVIATPPRTAAEVAALREQRSELSDQLISANNRRENLAEELADASGASRAGIEARISLLDQRILQIEGDIASTGRLLSQAPGDLLAGTQDDFNPFPGMRPDLTAISVVFTVFVLTPIAISIARLFWRRGSIRAEATPTFDRENSERLQRLEQAVDSIAIELERVSEGQRFVTRLLAESHEKVRIEAPRG